MRLSRVAGACYLPVFLLGPFALLYVRGAVLVPGDATATARRLAEHGGLLRAGSIVEIYLALTDVVLAALFYLLFRPGGRAVALVMASLRFTWAVVAAIGALGNLVALRLVDHPPAALLLLDLHEDVVAIGFVAFGAHLAVLGGLGWRSRLLPRPVGALLVVAGAGYLTHSLLVLAGTAAPFAIMLPALPAELALCLWLLLKGPAEARRPIPMTTHVLAKEIR